MWPERLLLTVELKGLKENRGEMEGWGWAVLACAAIRTCSTFKRIVKQRLMDQFIQEWQSRVAENSVCSNYRLFKIKINALRNI